MRTYITAAICVLLCIVLGVSFCTYQKNRANRLANENRVAEATGKALDSVAKETPIIRQEQEGKQREVEKIEGSDTRLPDGFGKSLEQLRQHKGERRNP